MKGSKYDPIFNPLHTAGAYMRPIRITRGPIAIGPGMLHSGSGGGPSGPPKPKSLPGRLWDWLKKKLGWK